MALITVDGASIELNDSSDMPVGVRDLTPYEKEKYKNTPDGWITNPYTSQPDLSGNSDAASRIASYLNNAMGTNIFSASAGTVNLVGTSAYDQYCAVDLNVGKIKAAYLTSWFIKVDNGEEGGEKIQSRAIIETFIPALSLTVKHTNVPNGPWLDNTFQIIYGNGWGDASDLLSSIIDPSTGEPNYDNIQDDRKRYIHLELTSGAVAFWMGNSDYPGNNASSASATPPCFIVGIMEDRLNVYTEKNKKSMSYVLVNSDIGNNHGYYLLTGNVDPGDSITTARFIYTEGNEDTTSDNAACRFRIYNDESLLTSDSVWGVMFGSRLYTGVTFVSLKRGGKAEENYRNWNGVWSKI